MITITAMKWVPDFAAGNVRDHRLRWILKEVGWPYEVRLVDAPTLASAEYRAKQPFGQVPYLEEDGLPPLFETGAIALDIATRAGKLIPLEGPERAEVVTWVIAALNSVEPFLMNVAEVEFFLQDEDAKAARRPLVVAMAKKRLGQLATALGDRRWLVGDEFTVADLMMGSVLKIARSLDLMAECPKLATYQSRCLDRPAYREAVAEQRETIARHEMSDMKFDQLETADA